MQKTAILLGATGLTGGHLLNLLLEDTAFKKVVVFTRRAIGKEHPKLEEHIIDLLDLENYKTLFQGDVVFCCIGTTKANTPDRKRYKDIDYGIPVNAAKLAKQNNIPSFLIISAIGADAASRLYYNQLKGEMQRDVLLQEIEHTYLLQPSLIIGDRAEKRAGENFAKVMMKAFSFLISDKYKVIQGETIAKAMLEISKNGYSDTKISSEEIQRLGSLNN